MGTKELAAVHDISAIEGPLIGNGRGATGLGGKLHRCVRETTSAYRLRDERWREAIRDVHEWLPAIVRHAAGKHWWFPEHNGAVYRPNQWHPARYQSMDLQWH